MKHICTALSQPQPTVISILRGRSLICLTLFCLGLALVAPDASADIEVQAATAAIGQTPQGENGTVFYSTGAGGQADSTTPGPILSYRPDLNPGHHFFSCSSQYTGTGFRGDYNAGAQATVSATEGSIRATTGTTGINTNPSGTAFGKITDTLTFKNSSASPATIRVRFRVSGSYGHNGATGAVANHHMSLSLGGYFDLQGRKESDHPENDFDTVSFADWQTQQIDRPNQSSPAGTYTGTFLVQPGSSEKTLTMFVQAHALNGGFAQFGNTAAVEMELPAGVTMASASGVFLTTAFPRPANISTRGPVLSGDSAMIVGFIVNGTEGKKVIIRGIGPSLQKFGVAGALADPTLEVHGADSQGKDQILARNNNWQETQSTDIQNCGFAPSDPLESAVILTLNPGSYTAILRGQNGGTGNGLLELYDLDGAANSSCANLSTRGFVGGNDDVLIAGVIVSGTSGDNAKLGVRGLGPSLSTVGVAGALQNPTLTLYNGNGAVLAFDDDWKETQSAEITNAGLAPSDDRDSAIIASLPVGNYTAILRGKGNSTGVGLVEVYRIP